MPRTKSRPDLASLKAPGLAPPEEIAEVMALEGWGTPAHNAMEILLRKYYRRKDAYHACGVDSSGYWPDVNQKAVRVVMDQNKSFQSQLGALDFVPFIKEVEVHVRGTGRQDDYVLRGKLLDIFESTLSEGGSYKMLVCGDASYILVARWSSMYNVLLKTTSPYHMVEALRYVYVNNPYKWRDDPGNDADVFSRLEALLDEWERDPNAASAYHALRRAMYPNLQSDADPL